MSREEQHLYSALQGEGELVNLMVEDHRRVAKAIEKSLSTFSIDGKDVSPSFSELKSMLSETVFNRLQ